MNNIRYYQQKTISNIMTSCSDIFLIFFAGKVPKVRNDQNKPNLLRIFGISQRKMKLKQ